MKRIWENVRKEEEEEAKIEQGNYVIQRGNE